MIYIFFAKNKYCNTVKIFIKKRHNRQLFK
jgi:hypothetical protein